MTRLGLILLAGGTSSRFSNKRLKQLLPVLNEPLYLFVLDKLLKTSLFDDVVVVLHPDLSHPEGVKIAKSGATWMESVRSGFALIAPHTDKIVVHDAARPFFEKSDILKLKAESKHYKVVVIGSRVRNTLVQIQHEEMTVLDRKNAWEIYTPQLADREVFELKSSDKATDLITHALEHKIQGKILDSSPLNIKITYPSDQKLIEKILNTP